MTLPFGIAVYPDRGKKSTLDPLPSIKLTRTYHESAAGRIELPNGRLIQLEPKRRQREREDARGMPEVRSLRGAPGRETASVQRRPTRVRRELADRVMLAVLEERQRRARSVLARWIGVTPRHVHLAELGSVQPEALRPIADYFGIDVH